MNTKKLARLALLTSISLILFTVEMQLPNPFPIPGVKLGLANIITVYAVYHYRPRRSPAVGSGQNYPRFYIWRKSDDPFLQLRRKCIVLDGNIDFAPPDSRIQALGMQRLRCGTT